ncbi:hypothetical protein PINS_up005662 [Pythium insidiosum]|nr:hypothetical protein PINS_up005662 [Pythium insidiosum]
MRKILQGEFEFVAPYFDHVSPMAKDLIKRMLVVDSTKRLSAEQVLKHAWFKDLGDDDADHVLSVGKNLKEQRRLTTRNKFRAGVGAVIAVKKTQRLLSMKNAKAPT